MNEAIKNSLITTITKYYPGVLFFAINLDSKEMQLHYKDKIVTDNTSAIDLSQGEMISKLLGFSKIDCVYIFVEQKIITFEGGGKKVNL